MRLRVFTEPQQGATYGDQLRVAKAAEDLGFDAFFRSDHFLGMGQGSHLPGPTDAWLTLAGLARETSRIRLGTLVTSATFRLPGLLAVQVAQVDEMSGGRVELGLGSGWYGAEHSAYGVPFPPVDERFDRLEEQLEIVTRMWSAPVGATVDFDGAHYQLRGCPALPKPVQRPHPPVIVGGHGRHRTPDLVARFAAEYNVPFSSEQETGEGFDRVRTAAQQHGRDPRSVVLSAAQVVCVGADDAEFRRRAAAIGRDAQALPEQGLAGSPAQVVDKIGRFRNLGAERIYLQLLDLSDLDHLALVADRVLPQVS